MEKILSAYSHIELQDENKRPPSSTNEEICKSDPMGVDSYDQLVRHIAKIGYMNRKNQWTLFFRGQHEDYQNKYGTTTILPTIFRNNDKESSQDKFSTLGQYSYDLLQRLNEQEIKILGKINVDRYLELQWALLQHYEKCNTPMLDITHSLHVAASFALDKNKDDYGVIHVLAIPYPTDFLSYFPAQSLLLVKLANICPPTADRPLFQEAYSICHFPLSDLDVKERTISFDFKRRLIAKFKIPNSKEFWGEGFDRIPSTKLYQPKDLLGQLISPLSTDFI